MGTRQALPLNFPLLENKIILPDAGTERFCSSEPHSCPKLDFILPVSLPSPCLLDVALQHSRPLSRLLWCLLSHLSQLHDLPWGPSSPASLQPTRSPSHFSPHLYVMATCHLCACAAARGQDVDHISSLSSQKAHHPLDQRSVT